MPIILYSCSTGALISLYCLIQKYSDCLSQVSGLIIESPFLSTGIQIQRSFNQSVLMLIGSYLFPDVLIDFDILINSSKKIENYRNVSEDCCLYHLYIPIWLFRQLLETITIVRKSEIPKIPILMLQGDDDGAVDPIDKILGLVSNNIVIQNDGIWEKSVYN
jgi:alpha-beta hydrolase superfamily lysophospholipase